jgi:hypothetical protein
MLSCLRRGNPLRPKRRRRLVKEQENKEQENRESGLMRVLGRV